MFDFLTSNLIAMGRDFLTIIVVLACTCSFAAMLGWLLASFVDLLLLGRDYKHQGFGAMFCGVFFGFFIGLIISVMFLCDSTVWYLVLGMLGICATFGVLIFLFTRLTTYLQRRSYRMSRIQRTREV